MTRESDGQGQQQEIREVEITPAERRTMEKRAASADIPEDQAFAASTEPSGGSTPPEPSGQTPAQGGDS